MGILSSLGIILFNYNTFEKWVDASLSKDLSSDIKAFCFNLYEYDKNKWAIEIIGSPYFDEKDSDWACLEVYDNREDMLSLTWRKSWEKVQRTIETYVKKYLDSGKYASLLKSKEAIGVGFVDGDLKIVYQNGKII